MKVITLCASFILGPGRRRSSFISCLLFTAACLCGSFAFADPLSSQQVGVPNTPSTARSTAELATISNTVSALMQQKFNPATTLVSTTTALPPPVTVADTSNGQIPSLSPVSATVPVEAQGGIISQSGSRTNLVLAPLPEQPGSEPKAIAADAPPFAKALPAATTTSTTAASPPVTVADTPNGQMPSLPPVSATTPTGTQDYIISQSGNRTSPASVSLPERPAPEPKAIVADATPFAKTLKTETLPETPTISAGSSEKTPAKLQNSPQNAALMDTVTPEATHAWELQLQTLEQENQMLRQKLRLGVSDPLRDIEVDAVANIHEDVLRTRIAELEKEIDKLNMKSDDVLPQKTKPDHPVAPPPKNNVSAPRDVK